MGNALYPNLKRHNTNTRYTGFAPFSDDTERHVFKIIIGEERIFQAIYYEILGAIMKAAFNATSSITYCKTEKV